MYPHLMAKHVDEFKEVLQENKLRVTKSRLAVFTILDKFSDQFLSPDEVFDLIHSETDYSCDRASVYRVLATLADINLLNVTQFQGQASKYQIHHHTSDCGDCHEKHEHYFKCLKCDAIQPIGDCFIDAKIKELAKKGFLTLGHHLEITGHCPSCN